MDDVKTHILVGDISSINAQCIVTSANKLLTGGCGVDCAIHKYGGEAILNECKKIKETTHPKGLNVGEAIITSAGNLKADFIIHTLVPKHKLEKNPEKSLSDCYKNSFLLADKHKCTSIAFPSIATGVYAYPKKEAAKIAQATINKLLKKSKYIKDVIFVFFTQEDADIFTSMTHRNTL